MHPDETRIQPEALRGFTSRLFERAGLAAADAEAVGRLLVDTDLRGIFSHGTRLAPLYLEHIEKGHMNPRPQPRVDRETPAMALIDADRGIGHLAALDAMDRAIQKARSVGVGMVSVRRSHHLGAASLYALRAVSQGMIGFATTSTGGASVAPHGGRGAALANHPLAWAVPTRAPFPIVVDIAVGVSAWGRVETHKIYGQPIPAGWCLDRDGNPTEDPAKAWTMFPAGGTRGYGLALVAGIIGGLLAGGQTPSRRARYDASFDSEHTLLAISIEHFVPTEQFLAEVDELIAACHRSEPLPGFDRVHMPGELEWEKESEWRVDGIPLHRDHLNRLAQAAERLGVATFW